MDVTVALLRRLMTTDTLTGLPNRRGFAALAADWLRAAQVGLRRPHLVLVDIDLFSSINDVYGRPAGDEAIVAVAAAVGALAGPGASMARQGPDELGVLVDDHPDAVDRLAARISETVPTLAIPHAPGRTLSVSVAVAAALPDDDVGSWMMRGARALRDAKIAGRIVHAA